MAVLRKADVIDGAWSLVDSEGLDDLTMRRLGASLDVRGSAIYRHFPTKEALLDAMADRLLEGAVDSLPDIAWPDQLALLADRLRTALLSRRDGARVVAGAFANGANTIAGTELAISVLCRAGLRPAQAGWLAFALFYYVLGHTIEEQAQVRMPPGDDWRSRTDRLDIPTSSQYEEALESLTSVDPAERFAYGLRTFIEGIISRAS